MNHTQRIVTLFVAAVIAVGCSGSDDEALPPVKTVETTTSSSDTTATTPTTEETTTSSALSEQALAEAEIRDVVTGWWQLEFDTSKGEGDLRLEALTGLLRQRVEDTNADLADRGIVQRALEPNLIGITDVSIDLEDSSAWVDACTGTTHEFLDAETSAPLEDSDPDEPFTSEFQLRLVDEEWKISEWYPSAIGGNPVACEIAP